MKRQIWFITGTGTDAGKTVFASCLARYCVEAGWPVAALKPVSSGNRADAQKLRAAAGRFQTLNEINPWHFRAPIAPVLAARRERQRISAKDVLAFVRRVQDQYPIVIVEGAGGLLSPLGEKFDSRDLIVSLRATPIIVGPNRLGAVNDFRLALAALPTACSRKARIILMSPRIPDAASRGNPALLTEFIGRDRLEVFPWLPRPADAPGALLENPRLRRLLARVTRNWFA